MPGHAKHIGFPALTQLCTVSRRTDSTGLMRSETLQRDNLHSALVPSFPRLCSLKSGNNCRPRVLVAGSLKILYASKKASTPSLKHHLHTYVQDAGKPCFGELFKGGPTGSGVLQEAAASISNGLPATVQAPGSGQGGFSANLAGTWQVPVPNSSVKRCVLTSGAFFISSCRKLAGVCCHSPKLHQS